MNVQKNRLVGSIFKVHCVLKKLGVEPHEENINFLFDKIEKPRDKLEYYGKFPFKKLEEACCNGDFETSKNILLDSMVEVQS